MTNVIEIPTYHNVAGQALRPELCPDVVFATPSLSQKVTSGYQKSLLHTVWTLREVGIMTGHMQRDGDQFIAKARNKMFADFLHDFPTTQNFFFLDDDVEWPAQKVVEFLMRPEPVLAGAYPKKSRETDFPVAFAVNGEGKIVERDGLALAILAPTGFMRIKREVIERLCMGAKTFKDVEADGSICTYPAVFESGVGPDGWWWGEDKTFCKKWQDMGGEVWVDTDIRFGHHGMNTWHGNCSEVMYIVREKAAKAAADAAAAEAVPIGMRADNALAAMIAAALPPAEIAERLEAAE